MGYRIYLGSISNKRLKQIQNISSHIELFKVINNTKDGTFDEEDCYCGVYDVSEKRLHEFGKYIEWTEELSKKYSKPIFKNKAFNNVYTNDHDFFIINKEGLKYIINDLNKDMLNYTISLNILTQMLEILSSENLQNISEENKINYNKLKTNLKEYLKYDYGDFSLDIEELKEMDELKFVKDMIFKKIKTHFLDEIYDFKINARTNYPNFLNLSELEIEKHTITNSWFKDKAMLELAHIYKTFDFKHNKLIIYGY